MSVQFANPRALVLLVLVVPAVWWARRSLGGLGRVRGAVALALRLAIIVLVVLALAQAQWLFTRDDIVVIYVVDQSLSIPAAVQRNVLAYVRESQRRRKSDDQAGLVVFGQTAALERRPQASDLLEPAAGPATERPEEGAVSLQSVVSPQRTNVSAGLRLALAAFPASGRKRIVLVSDGNENIGSAAEQAEVAAENGVRIDVLPVRYDYEKEVLVEKVVTQPEVEKGAGFEVRTVVRAYQPGSALLRLFENGTLIGSETVELRTGRNVFVAQRQLPEPGSYTYDAQVESATDTLHANNRASGFTVVRGRGRALHVEGAPGRGVPLMNALAAQGLDVRTVGVEALPLTISGIMPYDAVILSDVSAGSLGDASMRALELAVKDFGVGLVVIGGENAFGPGGYAGSDVERALPVTMDVKERRIMPSGALVVILHTCEIPQGNYWAQQMAQAALRVLSPSDEYGIIYYGMGGETWLFPLQRVADKTRMAGLISGVGPGDMPSFIASMEMAHEALNKSNASVKHVVIISDGDPAYPDDKAVLAMVADKITVTTIGISPHSSTDTIRLARVAQLGQGRYYEPTVSSALPQIFIKEAAVVRRSQIFEEPFRPAQTLASEVLRGIAPDEYPTLRGYVVTTPKVLAEVPLATNHKDPLLAHWQYGLGRAVAFTSDAKARWAQDWLGWPKFGPFWSQVVRWASRQVDSTGLQVHTSLTDDRARVTVDVLDDAGRFVNELTFTGVLVRPDQQEETLGIRQTGPGRYEGEFEAGEPGTHYLALRTTDESGRSLLWTSGMVVPYSAEYRELSSNEKMLSALAGATDGRVLTGEEDVFARTFPAAPRLSDAWPHLLLLAALLVPADVFARRVFVDYRAGAARAFAWAMWLVQLRWWRAEKAPEATHVTALLSRKQVTREEMQERARKFAPAGQVRVGEPTLTKEHEEPRPAIEPAEPSAIVPAGPSVQRADETFTGRLLRARRRAREGGEPAREPDEQGDRSGPDSFDPEQAKGPQIMPDPAVPPANSTVWGQKRPDTER